MTEWGVVGVIIALAGLIATVVNPVIQLTKAVTTLTVTVKELQQDFKEEREQGKRSHEKLWDKNSKQDEILQNHEGRISKLEGSPSERQGGD